MKYKTIFVPAPVGTFEEKKLFGGTKTSESNVRTCGEGLAKKCEEACNALDTEGFEVIPITDLTRGDYMWNPPTGAGWSYTYGVLITARSAR